MIAHEHGEVARRPSIKLIERVEEPPYRLLDEAAIEGLQPPIWLIKGIVPLGEVLVVAGPGDAGKTFVVLDMALRIARHYPVVYVAAEDSVGVALRKRAWDAHYGVARGNRFFMLNQAVPLTEASAVGRFIAAIRSIRPRLVVVDTLSQCIAGADENSSAEMARVLRHCQQIADAGTTVILIHHYTKDGAQYRGSSVLKNNTYGFLEVTRRGEVTQLACGRIKNSAPFAPLRFRLLPVLTDRRDTDGEPIGSCVPILIGDGAHAGVDLTPAERRMLDAIGEATDAQGGIKTGDLERLLDARGSRFYSRLKALRDQQLISASSPLTITARGRIALGANLDGEAGDRPGSDLNTSMAASLSPFIVNQQLGVGD